MMQTDESQSKIGYFVHLDDKVLGPFERTFIDSMVSKGIYPPDVMVQRVGETQAFPLAGPAESAARAAPSRNAKVTVRHTTRPVAASSPPPAKDVPRVGVPTPVLARTAPTGRPSTNPPAAGHAGSAAAVTGGTPALTPSRRQPSREEDTAHAHAHDLNPPPLPPPMPGHEDTAAEDFAMETAPRKRKGSLSMTVVGSLVIVFAILGISAAIMLLFYNSVKPKPGSAVGVAPFRDSSESGKGITDFSHAPQEGGRKAPALDPLPPLLVPSLPTPELPSPSDPSMRMLYWGEEGMVYEVPAVEHARLEDQRRQLEEEKKAAIQRIEDLNTAIAGVNKEEPDQATATDTQLDAFRKRVVETKVAIENEYRLVESYRTKASAFKAELTRVGRAVAVKWR